MGGGVQEDAQRARVRRTTGGGRALVGRRFHLARHSASVRAERSIRVQVEALSPPPPIETLHEALHH